MVERGILRVLLYKGDIKAARELLQELNANQASILACVDALEFINLVKHNETVKAIVFSQTIMTQYGPENIVPVLDIEGKTKLAPISYLMGLLCYP